jgi:hypothetical protein
MNYEMCINICFTNYKLFHAYGVIFQRHQLLLAMTTEKGKEMKNKRNKKNFSHDIFHFFFFFALFELHCGHSLG